LYLVDAPKAFGAPLNKRSGTFFLMTKTKITALFLACLVVSATGASLSSAGGDGQGDWRTYSKELNGDVYFFDASRVEASSNLRKVWSRIRYMTSVMGAQSYQSLLEIDCAERTEKILQNTFFSDKHWKEPAMNTDMTEKPKRLIAVGSATERLSSILCN
jgi:hypothetical protein